MLAVRMVLQLFTSEKEFPLTNSDSVLIYGDTCVFCICVFYFGVCGDPKHFESQQLV
jgi:hypothetical protein